MHHHAEKKLRGDGPEMRVMSIILSAAACARVHAFQSASAMLLVCVRGNAGGANRQMQDMAGERGPEIGPMGTEHAGVGFGSTYDADEHRDRAGSPVRPLLHLVSYDCILDLVPTHSCGEDSSSSSQKPKRRVSPLQAFVPEGGQKAILSPRVRP